MVVLFFAGTASAKTWSDYDYIGKYLKEGQSYFWYDLDISVADDFVVGVDKVGSAEVSFWLYDDSNYDGFEYASLWIEETGWFDVGEVTSDNGGSNFYGAYTVNQAGLDTINAYGNLFVGAYAQYTGDWSKGDFYWKAAKLTAHAPVPEPSTILLMGAGLAALAGYRRKRKKNQNS